MREDIAILTMLLSNSYGSSKGHVGGSRHSSLRDCRGARDIGYHEIVVAISCSMQEGEVIGEYAKEAARGR